MDRAKPGTAGDKHGARAGGIPQGERLGEQIARRALMRLVAPAEAIHEHRLGGSDLHRGDARQPRRLRRARGGDRTLPPDGEGGGDERNRLPAAPQPRRAGLAAVRHRTKRGNLLFHVR